MNFSNFRLLKLYLKFGFYKQVPDFYVLAPGKISDSAIGSLGADSGGEGRNSGEPSPDLAGNVAGGDVGSPRVPFRGLDGSEKVPERWFGGAVDLRPPLLLFRRTGRRRRRSEGPGRCLGCMWWWRKAQTGRRWLRRRSSAVAAPMAGGGRVRARAEFWYSQLRARGGQGKLRL